MAIKNIILAAFVLVSGICLLCSNACAIPPGERQALIDLYNSTDGPNWLNTVNNDKKWVVDGTGVGTECDWKGIICYNGNVAQLILENNNLKGAIPSSISALSGLQALKLGANQLIEVPAELGKLSLLELLALNDNELTSIPWELGNLYNLTGLYLNNNQLTEIPAELRKLSSLKFLYLNNNLLTDIPGEIGYLFSLISLNLSNNGLTSMPAEMGNLKQLLVLNLESNLLAGSIPMFIRDLANLQEIYLGNNQLTGTVPTELGALSNLTVLSLESNQLTGSIPMSVGNLANLQKLYLGNNQLTDTVPSEMGTLSSLIILSLENNLLLGPVPGELINLTRLLNGKSDFRHNVLFTPVQELDEFLSKKQIGGDWESTQAGQMDKLYSAILLLRVMTGLTPEKIQFFEDVNSDNKRGLEEIVYILQNVSGLRQ